MKELIRNIRIDIENLYMHENDADFYEDQLREEDYSEYGPEELESFANQERNEAHQLHHVIQCDLVDLSEQLGRKVTMEDFTDGEFKS